MHPFAPVESVPSTVKNLPVEGRLRNFWDIWTSMGVSSRVVSILKGYNLPF